MKRAVKVRNKIDENGFLLYLLKFQK